MVSRNKARITRACFRVAEGPCGWWWWCGLFIILTSKREFRLAWRNLNFEAMDNLVSSNLISIPNTFIPLQIIEQIWMACIFHHPKKNQLEAWFHQDWKALQGCSPETRGPMVKLVVDSEVRKL